MTSLRQTPSKHVPKHRQPAARRAPRTAVRTMLVLSSLAVVGTGTAVAGGALTLSPQESAAGDLASAPVVSAPVVADAEPDRAAAVEAAQVEAAEREVVVEERAAPVSRSDRRGVADPLKLAALAVEAEGNTMARSEDASDEDPRTIGRALMAEFGFSSDQFDCLDSLWTRESNWTVDADNPTSSAYGIPQSLPGSKMASAGADWATNPVTQIRWGLGYIDDRYGSPCSAWGHSQSVGWY